MAILMVVLMVVLMVILMAIQMAIRMKFQTIIVIGVDVMENLKVEFTVIIININVKLVVEEHIAQM